MIKWLYYKLLKKKIQPIKYTNSILFSGVEFIDSTIGRYSYIARNSAIRNTDIGSFCSIGPHTIIGYGDHPVNFISTSPVFYQASTSFKIKPKESKFWGDARVKVGNDVWIGANCYIKNGIIIGDGAIIAANSFVNKDVDSYSIVGGVPAKLLRYRFSKEDIEKLLDTQWWELPDEIIESNLDAFSQPNVIEFLREIKSKID